MLVRQGDNAHCLHTANVTFTWVPMLMSWVWVQVTTGVGIAAGHENVTHTHTHTGKGIKTRMGYPYLCQSLLLTVPSLIALSPPPKLHQAHAADTAGHHGWLYCN